MISQESRRLAGILLVILPTVLYGGYFLLTQLISAVRDIWTILFARTCFVLAMLTPGFC